MAGEIKVNIGIDGVVVETELGFGAWSREFISFDYGNWSVYVESNGIDYASCDLTLQFTDDGKIIFSCSNHFYDDRENEERREDADECSKYKNFEITEKCSIKNECFFIEFVKGDPIIKLFKS
jgi:hypothetical protein